MSENEDYLSKQNITKKTDNWLSELIIPPIRKSNFNFSPKKSALLVIDMQKFFLNKESHSYIPAATTIVSNVNLIISKYREKKFPIIFTFHAYEVNENPGVMSKWWGDMLRVNNPLSEIHSSIDLDKDDILLRKNRYSAFVGTNLDKILKEKKIDSLVITGIMTHLCCETTARDAFMRDYDVYFIIDATATETESLHISSLRTLTDGFTIPMKTSEIIEEFNIDA
jgi:isochorismate hydrolase